MMGDGHMFSARLPDAPRRALPRLELEFHEVFWLLWAAGIGLALGGLILLIDLALPSAAGPSVPRLLLLWPAWLAIALSDLLFVSGLYHGAGREIYLLTSLVGVLAGVTTGGLMLRDPLRLRLHARAARVGLTLLAIWLVGALLSTGGWQLDTAVRVQLAGAHAGEILGALDAAEPGAPWHREIRGIATHDHTVEVRTLLAPDDRSGADGPCAAVSGYLGNHVALGLPTTRIRAVDGSILCGGQG